MTITATGTATATDLGHSLISEFLPDPVSDTYTTGADQMVLEDATVDLGEVKRIQLTNKVSDLQNFQPSPLTQLEEQRY